MLGTDTLRMESSGQKRGIKSWGWWWSNLWEQQEHSIERNGSYAKNLVRILVTIIFYHFCLHFDAKLEAVLS